MIWVHYIEKTSRLLLTRIYLAPKDAHLYHISYIIMLLG